MVLFEPMHPSPFRRRSPLGPALAGLFVTSLALGSTLDFAIRASVNGHEFSRVRVDASGCVLNVRLDFSAPESGYSSKAKNRNHHRFRARLLFKNGKALVTKVFNNRAAGKRTYGEQLDTSDGACWGKEQLELKDVEVVGCRGTGCTMPDFAHALPDWSG